MTKTLRNQKIEKSVVSSMGRNAEKYLLCYGGGIFLMSIIKNLLTLRENFLNKKLVYLLEEC